MDNIKEQLVEMGFEDTVLFENPNYKSAIVGYDVVTGRVIYSYNLMIEHLMTVDNMSEEEAIEFIDFGTNSNVSTDYNDYAEKVSKAVLNKEADLGILICGTGIGMSIVANKFKGIRCGHCHDVFSAKMTRLHNNSNMLALGASVVSEELAMEIVDTFLDTEFSNEERHIRRIDLIEK